MQPFKTVHVKKYIVNSILLRVYSHLRFITRLRSRLPLGSRMGCAPIFIIVIPINTIKIATAIA